MSAPAHDRAPLLTEKQAAEYLGIHPDTLSAKRRRGEIEYVRFSARARVHYRREALDAYIESHTVDAVVVGMKGRGR